MLVIISPAKTLKTDLQAIENSTTPVLINKAKKLAGILKGYNPTKLSELMGISTKLSWLNFERYQQWKSPYIYKDAFNAIYAFRGEVYNGLDIDSFSEEDVAYTKDHLRILSGLYGVLKPLDAILPYRLEMGTKLTVHEHKNLYQFWGDLITQALNKDLKAFGENTLINLASEEYFKSINTKLLKANIITPIFKENKNDNYKIISIYAKKARGMMTRFIMKNRITHADDIKHFEHEGYYFNEILSNKSSFVFTRG